MTLQHLHCTVLQVQVLVQQIATGTGCDYLPLWVNINYNVSSSPVVTGTTYTSCVCTVCPGNFEKAGPEPLRAQSQTCGHRELQNSLTNCTKKLLLFVSLKKLLSTNENAPLETAATHCRPDFLMAVRILFISLLYLWQQHPAGNGVN